MSVSVWRQQRRWAPYLFVSPFVVLFAVFMLYPLGRSALLAFTQSAGSQHMRWVGAANFAYLLHDAQFWTACRNTALFAAGFVGVLIPAALALALLLDHPRVRGKTFFRFAFFCPHLVGTAFVGIIFMQLLSPTGPLSCICEWLGQTAQQHGFMDVGGMLLRLSAVDPLNRADLVMPVLVAVAVWMAVGYAAIYLLAALQAVERELYEAAAIDGAGPWQRFRHITVPGIQPTLWFLVLVNLFAALQVYELPTVLMRGAGKDQRALTVVMYLYQQGFSTGDLGYAAAIGWALVAGGGTVALVRLWLMRRSA